MRKNKIPDVVVRRLPRYLRAVEDFYRRDHQIVSSRELGDWTSLTPTQVRKDLTFFGEFGKQGIGYNVQYLMNQLREILRLSQDVHMGIVGFGNLGRALVHFNVDTHSGASIGHASSDGLRIVAAFDVDPEKVGSVYAGVPVFHVDELQERVKEFGLKIVIVTVPANHAQAVVDECVAAGVKAIHNFAPVNVMVPPDVKVHSSDLTLEMQSLAFYTE